ncbi:CapA family protein [Cohnella endophytica]|uniref:CapA family protein n=1 Tax=Cohnella endophytica TaxID=2419778 RepID=UPI00131449D6|nr:CapA family protein [Cohnella endophytica]
MVKRLIHSFTIGLLAIWLAGCSNDSQTAPSTSHAPTPSESTAPSSALPSNLSSASATVDTGTTTPKEPQEPETREATLIAIGDIMAHSPQLPGYYDQVTKRYDFSSWFSEVAPIFSQGDWVIGNLETPIAGKDLKFTGFPRFNAPKELAEAVKGAGVQLVSTANNHAMDRGYPGILRTLDNVKKAGLIPVGTSSSAVNRQRLIIEERNGIRMGFLAYSYGTNGIPVPPEKSYAINLIDVDVIRDDIARMKQAGADVVTVSLHFGIEYQRLPNADQTTLARELVKSGADIILGSHPHVVQPYAEIDVPATESDDGTDRKGIVIYSLGNFISNQTGDWKDVGLIFGIHLVKTRLDDGTYETHWDKIAAEPTWVQILVKNKIKTYKVIPLNRALAKKDIPSLTAKDYANLRIKLSQINKHLAKLSPHLKPTPAK